MKKIYAAAPVVGTVVPRVTFAGFFGAQGFVLPAFVRGLFINGAAGGFAADEQISPFVLRVWSDRDAAKNRISRRRLVRPARFSAGLFPDMPWYFLLRMSQPDRDVTRRAA